MSGRDKLWLALREEPLFDASDEEIARFIEDSAQQYEAYVKFVNKLKESLGDRCVIYRGLDEGDSAGLEVYSGRRVHPVGQILRVVVRVCDDGDAFAAETECMKRPSRVGRYGRGRKQPENEGMRHASHLTMRAVAFHKCDVQPAPERASSIVTSTSPLCSSK